MPVLVTVHNIYYGWALVAGKLQRNDQGYLRVFFSPLSSCLPSFHYLPLEGFLLLNPLLCQVGALIGFSGAIRES